MGLTADSGWCRREFSSDMTIEARFQLQKGTFTLDVDLRLPAEGVTSLLGPSGCGKTTLLRVIAGLEKCRNGFLKLGDEVWQDNNQFVPPHQRSLGYVFQESSLFEHMNVRDNVAYGVKRVPEKERRFSLDKAIELTGIEHLLARKPATLSGGERQRVAIARALAVSPGILLMDEPLAALDPAGRQEILPTLESLHDELDIPVIYVTHDQEEAFSIADRILILNEGRIVQSGSPQYIYTHPADLWVASFFGLNNRLEGKICSIDPVTAETAIGKIAFSCSKQTFSVGAAVDLVILPTAISIKEKNRPNE